MVPLNFFWKEMTKIQKSIKNRYQEVEIKTNQSTTKYSKNLITIIHVVMIFHFDDFLLNFGLSLEQFKINSKLKEFGRWTNL